MREHLIQLRRTLAEFFDESELRTLCFDLGVDYASLPPGGKTDKARDLVAHLERHDRIRELVQAGRRLRPDILWEKALKEWAQAQLDVDMDRLRTKRDQVDKVRRARRERQRVVNVRPLDVTCTFKDRLHEIQALCNHLTDNNVRFVSVVGRSGTGKTALVSHVLANLEQGKLPVSGPDKDFSLDGILYFSAHSTGLNLERIYADVGRMLGEPAASKLARWEDEYASLAARWADPGPLAAKVEYLLETMRDGLYLILLDGLEEYLTADGEIRDDGLRMFIERCLKRPTGARLLVTSRQEVQFATVLQRARCISLREGLPEKDGTALLRDLDPQGRLGLQNALEDDLRRAVRLTQGIPRALEILAGILHQDQTTSLPGLLADEYLFGEQVVERLVAAGHRRLGEYEQRVMEALAVFNRPVEVTAIAYLLHTWFPALDVQTSLRRLLNGYFVNVNRNSGEYSLHPLDLDYACRQIPTGAETEQQSYSQCNLELRAADFYASIRKPESEWKSIDDLAPQLAEFEHRIRAGDYDGAYRLLESIDADFLFLWGHYARLIELREKLLRRLTDPGLRAGNLGNLGRVYRAQGRIARAVTFFEKALTGVRKIDQREGEGVWLGDLGSAYRALGQVERAIELLKEGLSVVRRTDDRRLEGVWLGDLGNAYYDLGQFDQAIQYYEQALAIYREIGDRMGQRVNAGRLNRVFHYLGKSDPAVEFFERALNLSREVGDRKGESINLSRLGCIYHDVGQVDRAIKLFEDALVLAREVGDRLGENHCLQWLGEALLFNRKLSRAQQCCREVCELDMPLTGHLAALTLGMTLLHQRDPVAGDIFVKAVTRCRIRLDETADLYEARYALAAALVGSAVCDPDWAAAQRGVRNQLLAPALLEYQRALKTCTAPGIVRKALHNLEMIRAVGIEGLEPVFDLLENAGEMMAG